MAWNVPRPPSSDLSDRLHYWHEILAIPEEEPSAVILRQMARERIERLQQQLEQAASNGSPVR